MAFNGQTLTDYGTRATYSVPAFTSGFLTKLSSLITTISSPAYNDIEISLNTSLVSPRIGRASDSLADKMVVDTVTKAYLESVKRCGESGGYVVDYEGNSLWQTKTYADDLYKKADLDRRVWVLQNQTAMKDRERLSDTGVQDDLLIHKSSESAYGRTAKGTLQSDQFSWEAAESLLDRGLETTLQNDEQSHRTTENGYVRTQRTTIQNDRQSWEAAESLLDRTAETNLQDADQLHKTTEANYERVAKDSLASDRFVWEAAESLLDRTSATNLQDDEQSHRGTEAGYIRTQKTTIQNDRQSWEASKTVLDRAAEITLQDGEQAHRTSENAYSRSITSTLASDQYVWEAAESVLDRAAETTLLTTTLAEKLLIEREKMDNEEDMKRLEWNLDVWKINSNHWRSAGANLESYAVATGIPLFWDWTDGSLSITNPW